MKLLDVTPNLPQMLFDVLDHQVLDDEGGWLSAPAGIPADPLDGERRVAQALNRVGRRLHGLPGRASDLREVPLSTVLERREPRGIAMIPSPRLFRVACDL